MMILNRRVALVSGSTRGIGKAIAERLIKDEYLVFRNSRKKSNNTESNDANYFAADVTSPHDCKLLVDSVIATHGRLDLLVCNVGSGVEIGNEATPAERWEHYLTTNLLSATNLTNAALDSLQETKGSVIAISSICGESTNPDAPIEYSVSKSALNAYIKLMAVKYAPKGVRFNIVSPGNVIFEGSTWDTKLRSNTRMVQEYINLNVPMKKFIKPEEIAAAVSYLSSSENSSTTGAIITIDGGQSL